MAVGVSKQRMGVIWSIVIALEAPPSVLGGNDSHQVQILPGTTQVCGEHGVCGRTENTTAAHAKHSSNTGIKSLLYI